jgi:ribosomal protein L11 methyltransferase
MQAELADGAQALIRLALRVDREHAEIVLAELLELAPSGVEEVDVSPDVVEYAVYGPPGELPALPDLRAAAGGALVDVRSREIADDWSERWRAFHKPLVLDGLTVRPPWEPAAAAGSDSIEIVIDPAQAFGTGAHATTRLCLELLLEPPSRAGPFVDLGCGSGVLAIAAAKLGYAPVLALDYDPASVAATIDNARVNGVVIDVRGHDLRAQPTPPAATIAANLLGPLLVEWAAELASPGAACRPQRVIASGLLVTEIPRVSEAFASAGLHVASERTRAEWAALLLVR